MTISTLLKKLIMIAVITGAQSAFAFAAIKPWYVSGNFGIFQGNYALTFNDQSDSIPQNVRQNIQQNGYVTGLALGYQKLLLQNYFLGTEVLAQFAFNNANFANGSLNFTDQLKIQSYFDWLIVSGFFITESVTAYGKAGISWAFIKDSINSPTGFTPTMVTTNTNKSTCGIALGLGMKKLITQQFAIFSEYQYHDYGKVNFPGFQNFTANYSHSAHLYTQAITIGVSYLF